MGKILFFFFFCDRFALAWSEELCNRNNNLLTVVYWNNLGDKEFSAVTYVHY